MKFLIKFGAVFIFLISGVPGIAQVDTVQFNNHGPQLFASMIQGSAFLKDGNGRELIYTVVRGEPAHLLGYDVETKDLLVDLPLGEADGAWDMAQTSDGTLYIPGADGTMFSHKPGSAEVIDLGVALEGETYLWNLTAGKDAEVFGATYPGCRVFRYHPADGFSDVGKGPLVENENYVRSIAYYHKTEMIYAGVGSKAHLIEINPKTGEKRDILPEKYQGYEFVYGLEIVPGIDGNDRLFVLLTNGSVTLVYNLKSGEFEQEIERMDMRSITGVPSGDAVYYTSGGSLKRFDPAFSEANAEVLEDEVGTANAFSMGNEGEVYVLTSGANLIKYDPKSRRFDKTKLNVPGQPIPIQSLMYGPDGNIWSGGYLAGGNATYNPLTGEHRFLPGLDQTEGMSYQEDKIYFGVYPKGKFYEYDIRIPWDPKGGNPRMLGQIPNQSRSFAQVSIPEKEMVVFGMIPEYGKLGGALITYDLNSDELKGHPSPVDSQAISGLIYTGEYVLVGTTISGGLGIKPTTTEAVLVGWDPETGKKLFQTVPIPGASALTGFIKGPDGNIWGMGDGTLFKFDPIGRKVVNTHKMYEFPEFKSHIWRSSFLILHPDGHVYGTDNKKLFRIDPKSMILTELSDKAGLLVMDNQGTLFFRRGTDLWSFRP
ncbi:hypothetical protein LZF95_16365 [Algoriphagus sp. AGSA1]|uniref:hypothetical protein n=1 Tax=unclassified Algoriphagus TaxID=2641541 RepID=UPI001CE1C9C7|nr:MULTISPECIES: hypothetical protein [unclassified Algoriphagus]MCE7056258.1 hypothetical protein [Algoriphagus sp. AGSA1]